VEVEPVMMMVVAVEQEDIELQVMDQAHFKDQH
jgi:hypothetical protein